MPRKSSPSTLPRSKRSPGSTANRRARTRQACLAQHEDSPKAIGSVYAFQADAADEASKRDSAKGSRMPTRRSTRTTSRSPKTTSPEKKSPRVTPCPAEDKEEPQPTEVQPPQERDLSEVSSQDLRESARSEVLNSPDKRPSDRSRRRQGRHTQPRKLIFERKDEESPPRKARKVDSNQMGTSQGNVDTEEDGGDSVKDNVPVSGCEVETPQAVVKQPQGQPAPPKWDFASASFVALENEEENPSDALQAASHAYRLSMSLDQEYGYFSQHAKVKKHVPKGKRAQRALKAAESHRTAASILAAAVATDQEDILQLTLNNDERKAILASTEDKCAKAKEALTRYHQSHFAGWFLRLRCGFNLLLTGLGSKKQLLTSFVRNWLTDGPVVVVNGYAPVFRINHLLTAITSQVLHQPTQFPSIQAHLKFIRKFLSVAVGFVSTVYVIIHNIDGRHLRNKSAQTVLSQLAALPNIRMVASYDHILTPLLWDSRLLAGFRWHWHDISTYQHYAQEQSYEEAAVGGTMATRKRGIRFVLESLTPNHVDILRLLGRYQLENPSGMLLKEFLGQCLDNMIVSSESALQGYLTELVDHALIAIRKVEGRRLYHIPHPPQVIRSHILADPA